MMTKKEAWDYITTRNPDFLTTGAHLAPAGLKRLFDTAYEVGYDNGHKEAYHVNQESIPEFLKGMFK